MASWKNYFAGKRVWVTGASSGIGEAIVDLLGSAGVTTLASARRVDRLEALAERNASVATLPLDLADRDALPELAARAWDLLGGVDVLINNAGISQRSLFIETDPAALERVVAIDLLATMRLTHAVASRMLKVGSGHIVAVTSVAAKVPTKKRSAYAAAKAGLHGLMDALRSELVPQGIAISLAVPGFVKTEMSYHSISETGGERGVLDPAQAGGRSSESCACEILAGVARKKRDFTVALFPRIRLALFLRRVWPGLLWKMLAKAEVT